MTDRDVARWRNSREWLNGGECCGDKDSDGICAAPACIFGEAVKELQLAADRIEKLELIEKAYEQNQQTWSRNIARIEKLEAALIAIKAIHHEGGIDDIEERDDRTYFIVCEALEGKDD